MMAHSAAKTADGTTHRHTITEDLLDLLCTHTLVCHRGALDGKTAFNSQACIPILVAREIRRCVS